MKHQQKDCQIHESNIPIFYNNTFAICLSKDLILHSRTKYIEIKHYFIKDYVLKAILDIKFVHTDLQWTYIFPKSIVKDRFNFIKEILNIQFIKE